MMTGYGGSKAGLTPCEQGSKGLRNFIGGPSEERPETKNTPGKDSGDSFVV